MSVGTLGERLVGCTVRSAATLFVCAGVAVFAAAAAASTIARGWPIVSLVAIAALQIGGAFLAAGLAAKYLERRAAPLLPNEHISNTTRPNLGGLLMVMAATLAAAPVGLLVWLRPFLQEWSEVVRLLRSSGIFTGPQDMSGLVLIPIFAALTPPMFELMALAAFVCISAFMLPLLLTRRPRFPRLYFVGVVLAGALVFAGARSAVATTPIADSIRQEITRTAINAQEAASMIALVDRYTRALSTAAPPLVWTLLIYVGWIPVLMISPRARATFANAGSKRDPDRDEPLGVETITTPPPFPGL